MTTVTNIAQLNAAIAADQTSTPATITAPSVIYANSNGIVSLNDISFGGNSEDDDAIVEITQSAGVWTFTNDAYITGAGTNTLTFTTANTIADINSIIAASPNDSPLTGDSMPPLFVRGSETLTIDFEDLLPGGGEQTATTTVYIAFDAATPTLTATPSPGSVTLSGAAPATLTDTATLSGGVGPTGTITFTLFENGGTIPVDTETVTATGDGTYTTPNGYTLPTSGPVAGTYQWDVSYSGDDNNKPVNASPEQETVSAASPDLSTTASLHGLVGSTLKDVAQLSAGYFPTGTITFTLTAPGGATVDTETVTVNGDGTYTTPTGFTVPNGAADGSYSWLATYSGDGNNSPVTSDPENVLVGPIPSPPAGTSAIMITDRPSTGDHEIYDFGNNSVLAAYPLTNIASPWQVAGLGNFSGTDTSDMLMRNSSTGAFEIFDVSNNNVTAGPFAIGDVGLEWTVSGFGDFSGNPGETDMVMRDSNNGAFEVYDISNNTLTSASALGDAGMEWQVLGFGDFSGNANETDMLTRDSNNGDLELYDISNNQVSSATAVGTIGTEWQFVGAGDFSGRPGETDMLMRDSNNGAFEVYDFSDGKITSASASGDVGMEWQVFSLGDFSGNANETDMLMRDSNDGDLELYDISNNTIGSTSAVGPVGPEWTVDGVAPYQSAAAAAASSGSSLLSSATATDLQPPDLPAGDSPLLNQANQANAPPSLDTVGASGLAGDGTQEFLQMPNVVAPTNAAGAQLPSQTFATGEAMPILGAGLIQHV